MTRMPIAFPTLRGERDDQGNAAGPPRVLGLGDEVVFRASYDPQRGRWVGPEAQHVEDLLASGVILGSEKQRERAAQGSAIEHERGCWPTPDGKPAQRPELRQRTKELVQREWERILAGGWKELRRIEGQESRADRADNAAAVRELADAIRSGRGAESLDPETLARAITLAMAALNEGGPVYAGSQSAGSQMSRVAGAETSPLQAAPTPPSPEVT